MLCFPGLNIRFLYAHGSQYQRLLPAGYVHTRRGVGVSSTASLRHLFKKKKQRRKWQEPLLVLGKAHSRLRTRRRRNPNKQALLVEATSPSSASQGISNPTFAEDSSDLCLAIALDTLADAAHGDDKSDSTVDGKGNSKKGQGAFQGISNPTFAEGSSDLGLVMALDTGVDSVYQNEKPDSKVHFMGDSTKEEDVFEGISTPTFAEGSSDLVLPTIALDIAVDAVHQHEKPDSKVHFMGDSTKEQGVFEGISSQIFVEVLSDLYLDISLDTLVKASLLNERPDSKVDSKGNSKKGQGAFQGISNQIYAAVLSELFLQMFLDTLVDAARRDGRPVSKVDSKGNSNKGQGAFQGISSPSFAESSSDLGLVMALDTGVDAVHQNEMPDSKLHFMRFSTKEQEVFEGPAESELLGYIKAKALPGPWQNVPLPRNVSEAPKKDTEDLTAPSAPNIAGHKQESLSDERYVIEEGLYLEDLEGDGDIFSHVIETRPDYAPSKEDKSVVPTMDKIDDLKGFAFRPAPKGMTLQCCITRDKKGMFPTYYLHLEREDGKRLFLMVGQKRKKIMTSNYLISVDQTDLSRDGSSCIGKVWCNILGTKYTVFDNGVNPNGKPFGQECMPLRQELLAVCYETNILGFKAPRKMTVIIPDMNLENELVSIRLKNEQETLLMRYQNGIMDDIKVLHNKVPSWNDERESFVLNFHQRVTMASVKNFQIIHNADPDYIVMQFGRVAEDVFTMDYSFPLSALQAFSICLTSLDGKLACK